MAELGQILKIVASDIPELPDGGDPAAMNMNLVILVANSTENLDNTLPLVADIVALDYFTAFSPVTNAARHASAVTYNS